MTRQLVADNVSSPRSFQWLCQMRFYFDPKQPDPLKQLSIHMANAKFNYGFEYLGVSLLLEQLFKHDDVLPNINYTAEKILKAEISVTFKRKCLRMV